MDEDITSNQTLHVEILPPDPTDPQGPWSAVAAVQLLSCPSAHLLKSQHHNDQPPGQAEQIDFINSLFTRQPNTTYSLRYIVQPDSAAFSTGKVSGCIFVKAQAPDAQSASDRAAGLGRQLAMLLGGTLPLYRWALIRDPAVFAGFWQPFDWQTARVVEIRRREEQVELDQVFPSHDAGFLNNGKHAPPARGEPVYYVHPFVPRSGGFERLLRTMLLHRAPMALTATLAPTALTAEEQSFLLQAQATSEGNRLPGAKNLARVQEQRAYLLAQGLLDQMLRLQNAPFMMTVSLASPEPIPDAICQMAGGAVTAPVGDDLKFIPAAPHYLHKGGFVVAQPADDLEWRAARANQERLLQEPWGREDLPESARRLGCLMDGYEAYSAFRFPQENGEGLPGLEVHTNLVRPLPRDVAQTSAANNGSALPLGKNEYLGLAQPVSLSARDRAAHLYVVGQTGSGKTTLLKGMALADMQAGRGLCVIDPHGDLFEELLETIPEHRKEDVVIFDPADDDHPVGFNLLECADDQQRQIVVREMRSIMRRFIEDSYQYMAVQYTGPVFYQHMQMNLLLAMSNPNQPGTLLEFYQIYQSRNYWRRWLPLGWEDEQLRRWVEVVLPSMDYTNRNHPQEASFGDYLSSKFVDFVFDPRLRLIFGQPRSTINLGRIMDEGKILLVNLAKGLIGEANAQFLGLMLMAKIQAEVMSRAKLDPAERKPFYIYVDEFQSLATDNFSVLLSEARKYNVSLTLANQFTSQISDPRIVQALFGNVGTILSFRLGLEDARMIEPQFLPYFDLTDLTNLPNWQVCVKAKINGQSPPPFILSTCLPDAVPSEQKAAAVRALSRQKYGRPRAEVEAVIAQAMKEPELKDEGQDEDGNPQHGKEYQRKYRVWRRKRRTQINRAKFRRHRK